MRHFLANYDSLVARAIEETIFPEARFETCRASGRTPQTAVIPGKFFSNAKT